MKTKTKTTHIPAPGRAAGLSGVAVCGRWATYSTGDHGLIRRLAASGGEHWCSTCQRRMSRGVCSAR